MMNLGPPPPPPPPPFSTGAPAPAPKPPAEVPSKAPPPVAIPAALAGAMLKEKKPFTYTPGGLNLAEIKSPRMQRRLQRNASLEGVRPSPLAQQPPQSPGHSAAATIPTHGMIQVQVLPMPGMGMTPVARPQPKEPPKPKRNVCGPAPPPPPFVISGENSNEPSPSATPLTTPATTPASSSGISSAATSALSSQSTAPVSNSHSLETDEQSTKDKTDMAAELGSNIPSPPPPPPSTASQKRYSLPPLSSQQSASSSRSESESLQSSLSTFSPPYTASQFSNDLNHNEKDDLVDILTGDEKSKSKTEEDKNVKDLHDDDNNHVKREVSNESVESTKEVSSTNYERESKGAAEINVEHKQTSPEIPITEDDKKNNAVQLNSEINLNNKNESERLEKYDPQAKLETKANAVGNNNLNFERSEENTAQSQNSFNSGKTLVQNNAHAKNNASNEVQVSSFSSTINVPLEKVKVNDNKVSPKTNEITQNTNSGQSLIYPSTPPTEIRNQNSMPVEKVSAVVVESKPSPKIKENHQNITSITFQPHRPNVRMATPPTEIKKNQNVNYDRMTRQASLPADGTSPQAIANKGSIYISPVRQISSDSSGQSKSAPQSAHCTSSSPTGLNKGPLPWMRGVKKESSPPPEFLIYAQKAQDRIQRQRSLTQQDRNQQYFDSQRNDTRNLQQNGYFQPSSPYSSTPNISMSSETSNNNEPQLQCNWRLPSHQSSLKNQQVPKLQQTQQQKSNLQNFNQPQTTLGRQTYQPSFSQFSQQQSMTLPKNRPRERIIPIMMEDSSPIISTSNIHMTGGTNNFQNKMNNSYQHFPQRQQSWSKSSSVPSSPMGTSAAFSPFDDANYHSSSNALEALQQMQQNLAKLNCGLQTSAQTPAQQNGAPFVIQHTGSHDPVQSRSFKLLQNAYDHQEPSGPGPGESDL